MKEYLSKKILVIGIVLFMFFSSVPMTNLTGAYTTDNGEIVNDFSTSSYNLSKYGGNKDMKLTDGTGFFDTYKDENGVWWFVDPEGYAFYSVGRWGDPFRGVNILKKYSSDKEWANVTRERIRNWGLNTFGCHGGFSKEFYLFEDDPIPYLFLFQFQHMGEGRWLKQMGLKVMPDVFDPYFWEEVEKNIIEVTNELKDDPYLLGYFLGNEMHWESSPIDDGGDETTLLEAFLRPDYPYPGKLKAVEFLKQRYENNGGIDEFNKVWKTGFTCWEGLIPETTHLGREGWRIQSDLPTAKLKLYKDDLMLLFNPSILVRARSDIQDFSRLVAKSFFKNVTEILHKYDPNHLTLGVRIHNWGSPREVLEEMGKYCDVISINYYRGRLSWYDVRFYLQSIRKGLIPLDGWLKKYYDITGKPLMITEWSHNLQINNMHKLFNRVENSMANYAETFTRNCMESPYIIGIEGGYGLLVGDNEEPIELVVQKTKEFNNQMYEIHQNAR